VSDTPWTYTFYDMRTREELAVLPLTGVSYTRAIRGVGGLNASLDLGPDKTRKLNPWRATRGRRTALYVEYGEDMVWGGPVTFRERSDTSEVMSISGVTWEGWLHRQRLMSTIPLQRLPLPFALRLLLVNAQQVTNVGLELFDYIRGGITFPGGDLWNRLEDVGPYPAEEVKPVLELMEEYPTSVDREAEFAIRPRRNATTGRVELPMMVGIPTLGRRYEDTGLNFSWPQGDLLHWKLVEDGSGADNVMPLLGAGSGPTQPFETIRDQDAGVDELASGYPSWMRDYRAQDVDDELALRRRGVAEMRTGLASEYVFTGVEVNPTAYIGRVDPGDDVGLQITSKALEEWPAAVTTITRVLGESVTVGDGGAGDSVKLTVGGVAA